MLEIIRNVNKYLEYQYQFEVDRTPLYDLSKINIYPTVDDDWHIYPLYGFQRTKETKQLLRWINTKIFNPIIRMTINQHSIQPLMETMDVRIRIAINMINKNIKDKQLKDIWISHIQKLYSNRIKACMQYYIDIVLPF